jgi:phenylpyruvate tautomerase PptA (4-oxalocrotonate tautomerase family)
VCRLYTAEERRVLMESVQAALVEAIHIPEGDRCVRLVTSEPGDVLLKAGQTEKFTLVEVSLFSGRSQAAKRALYQALVRRLAVLDIAPADVKVILYEVPAENWGIRGGQMAADIELGFKVDV